MGPITALRPIATNEPVGAGLAMQSLRDAGGRSSAVTATVTADPVKQISAASRAGGGLTREAHIPEGSRLRLEAAERAYMAACIAAGLNPLTNRVP